jgi:hypothetical protein
MINFNEIVGAYDILFVTLDTLRYDVATACFDRLELPNLSQVLPPNGWERRHTPGSFTYSAHQSFFAGFLPTPETPGLHPRLFAGRFEGSETTTADTYVYDAPTWVADLSSRGYLTICIGGVGFFNKKSALSRVLPEMFEISHWSEDMSVTSRTSTERQFALAASMLDDIPKERRALTFINVSAIHQPNCIFSNATEDSCETQAAALRYVDACLPTLLNACRCRGPTFCIFCSDHGTAYGEDGYTGHRLAHPVVWTVPYAEFILEPRSRESL